MSDTPSKEGAEKIEPCPWCGLSDPTREFFGASFITARIGCACGARGPMSQDKKAAIEAWNGVAAPGETP